jgi:hypothetical protein
MSATSRPVILLTGVLCVAGSAAFVRAEGVPAEYRPTIAQGLDWLAKQQQKDGHWEAKGGLYPVSMTGLCGMTLLMEGSTLREGVYKDNIRRAADWLMARSLPNGQIGDPSHPTEGSRYMYGHAFGLLFLSSVYGEEEDTDRRKKLEDILTRAAQFSREAQAVRVSAKDKRTMLGGWGYVSAKDGANFTENAVTVVQIRALRAARNAGIKVPPDAIKDAIAHLEDATSPQGGVVYSSACGANGEGRPVITAAAIACAFDAAQYNHPLVKKWLKFSQQHLPALGGNSRYGFEEYAHYYYAQTIYVLGENGYKKLFPGALESEVLTWTKYRKQTFDAIAGTQQADGSWTGGYIGPVFNTALRLSILQLDNAALPLHQHR